MTGSLAQANETALPHNIQTNQHSINQLEKTDFGPTIFLNSLVILKIITIPHFLLFEHSEFNPQVVV